jgi:hypothetical protein
VNAKINLPNAYTDHPCSSLPHDGGGSMKHGMYVRRRLNGWGTAQCGAILGTACQMVGVQICW